MTAPDDPPRNLRRLVIRGAGWMVTSQVATQALGFVASVVVARLLLPRELGLAAEALVFTSLALVIVDFGFASVLIQKPELTAEDVSTAFWSGMAIGIALTLVGVGLSFPIACLYGEPRVQGLFAALSLSFLLTAPGIVPGALLTRELRFRSLEIRTIIATAISAVVTIALAAGGAGPWTIVGQDLAISGASTALLWRSTSWRPTASFSRASLRGMARFTSQVFGTRSLDWGVRNGDNLLVGGVLGASALGAYTIAFNVVITPLKRIAIPATQVFFPAFSRMGETSRVVAVWLRAVRMVALIVVPLLAGVIVVAPDFVRVVFGTRWHAAVPVLQILAPVGLAQALQGMNLGVLQAIDRTEIMFRYSVVASIATIAAFAAGLPWGLKGVAVAYLAVSLVSQPLFLRVTTRAAGVSSRDWVRSVRGVFEAGSVMLVAVLGVRALAVSIGVPALGRLVLAVVTGGLVYALAVRWRAPEAAEEIRDLAARRRGDSSVAPVLGAP